MDNACRPEVPRDDDGRVFVQVTVLDSRVPFDIDQEASVMNGDIWIVVFGVPVLDANELATEFCLDSVVCTFKIFRSVTRHPAANRVDICARSWCWIVEMIAAQLGAHA